MLRRIYRKTYERITKLNLIAQTDRSPRILQMVVRDVDLKAATVGEQREKNYNIEHRLDSYVRTVSCLVQVGFREKKETSREEYYMVPSLMNLIHPSQSISPQF